MASCGRTEHCWCGSGSGFSGG
ncbi:hypothetical protein F6Q08_20810 [Pectobacterium parmentieri]|nr:hypothetical protein [Pectobacterium parmentieri]